MMRKGLVRVYPVALAADANYTGYLTHGFLIAHAKSYKDGFLKQFFSFDKIIPISEEGIEPLLDQLRNDGVPTIFLLSSYVWNHHLNIKFAKLAKKLLPNSLTIIGGPNIPRAEQPCKTLMNEYQR